jgi:hypothetical protein
MSAEAHTRSVQECITADDAFPANESERFGAALGALSLAEVEETAGELHRRIATTLREIGERRADKGGRNGPRANVGGLAVALELTAVTLGALAAGREARVPRLDVHPSMVAGIMYAAPTIPALLARLEQDRRLVASVARTLEARLDEECESPWGRLTIRRLVADVSIVHPARLAMELEAVADEADV